MSLKPAISAVLIGLMLVGCGSTGVQSGGQPAGRAAWVADAPYPLATEVALLLRACIANVENGAVTDLQSQGYDKQPRDFYYKGMRRDSAPATVPGDLITASTINYYANSCRFSVSSIGGPGTEQPFLSKVNTTLQDQMQRNGFRKVADPRAKGDSSFIWVKNGSGISLFVSGTAGAETASVAVKYVTKDRVATRFGS